MKTGEGQLVEGSLLSTALAFNNAALMEESVLRLGRQGSGTRGQYNAPTDSFRTRDGWVAVQVVGGGLFKRWAELMGEREWLKDDRFASDQSRGDFGEVIGERMRAWCSARSNAEVLTELSRAGVPCGELLSPSEVLNNEQVVGGKMLQQLEYPGLAGPAPVADHPLRFSRAPVRPFRRAPLLGEHTDEILAELGYSQPEIICLRGDGII